MKHIFSSVMLIGVLASTTVVRGQTDPDSTSAAPQSTATAPGQGGATDGQSLVAAAARNVRQEAAISADMRYRVDAFGHQLLGTGNYLQQGAGTETLVRLELKMQVGERPATLQEIRGQDFYWIRREVPPGLTTLGRVNLRQLRQSIARTKDARPGEVLPTDGWIMLGGLGRLLTSLEGNFDFAAPAADDLKFTAADGVSIERLPIWRVAGRWKKEKLAALTGGDPAKPAAKLPEQFPDRVELILGRTEQVLPLFPYRITYTRAAEPPGKGQGGAGEAPKPRELLTLEFFNVFRKSDIDARLFDYNPGDQVVQDMTTAYVQRYSSETKLR